MHREMLSQVNRGGASRPAPDPRGFGQMDRARCLVRRIPSGPEAVRAAQAAQKWPLATSRWPLPWACSSAG